MKVALYAGSQRSSNSAPGRTTRHSFSFGSNYDPDNLGFGPMICHNDDTLAPGAGYPDHPHAGIEIVTWVLEGSLVHTDSGGSRHVLSAGQAQVLAAGSGVRHSEVADLASGTCRFIQTWLRSQDPDGEPSYSISQAPLEGVGTATVVGGEGLPLRASGATLTVARLASGDHLPLPAGAHHHVFSASGSVRLAGHSLAPGDALRLSDATGEDVLALSAGELLVWSLPR